MVLPNNQAVPLQLTQGSGQHPLRDPFEPPRKLGMTQRTRHTQSMDDAKRPSIAGMGQHFTLKPVIIAAQRVTCCLRAGNHLSELWIVAQYHSCAFFCIGAKRRMW